MSRFFVNPDQIHDDYITLTDGDYYHVKNVLRMSLGEKIEISDGQGTDYECIIGEFQSNLAILNIVEKIESNVELSVPIVLYQGIPKKDKMELIIQKAVELGCSAIVPVSCCRSIVKLEDEKKEEKKRERWQSIAESAAKQCGRGVIPEVRKPLSMKLAMEEAARQGIILFPYENEEGMRHTQKAINQAVNAEHISIFIGPEGGFDPREVDLAREHKAEVISLGRRILRTETAGLCLLSVLMTELEYKANESMESE